MGNCLIKLVRGKKVKYLEWSSIVDAPATYGMTARELKAHIKWRYGEEGLKELPARMDRVENYGTSYYSCNLDDVIGYNRAGIDETCLTQDQLWDMYVDNKRHIYR